MDAQTLVRLAVAALLMTASPPIGDARVIDGAQRFVLQMEMRVSTSRRKIMRIATLFAPGTA
jgi:hypothetical protein